MTLSYYILYPIAWLIGILPYKIQFLVADVLRFMLHSVIRYRVNVVRENLRNAFPEKSTEELALVEKMFYNHLSDVFLETMSMASVTRKQIAKRMIYKNLDSIETQIGGKSWIAAMAHYGSWEYTINFSLCSNYDAVLAVYRPLADKGFDKYYSQARSRFGVIPVPMHEITRELLRRKNNGSKVAVAMIGDQTPPRQDSKEWVKFLNQDTQFFMGTEKMALRLGMPVVFMHVDKKRRGYYEATFEIIYDGKEKVEENEITKRYAAKLETMIRQRPELWMWSHRRWKHHPPYHPSRQKHDDE